MHYYYETLVMRAMIVWRCDVQFAEQIKDDDDNDDEEKARCATIWWAEENHGWAKARSSHLIRLFRTNQRVQHNSLLNTIPTVPFFWIINLLCLHQSFSFLIMLQCSILGAAVIWRGPLWCGSCVVVACFERGWHWHWHWRFEQRK